jgi:hypothetical protein
MISDKVKKKFSELFYLNSLILEHVLPHNGQKETADLSTNKFLVDQADCVVLHKVK